MNSEGNARMIDVLLVDDDPADVRLTREALKQSKIHIRLNVAPDGVRALEFLRRQAEHAAAPRPDIILLDLNMPRKDGREVLAELKRDPELRQIPVVVLTTSGEEEDILQSYRLQANCYVTKPVGLHQFLNVVRAIDDFWFTVVKLPPREGLL